MHDRPHLKRKRIQIALNTICMRFRFDQLSRAFSNWCVFHENAQRISVDGRPWRIEMYSLVWTGLKYGSSLRSWRDYLRASASFFLAAKSREDWSEDKSSLKLLRTHKKCDRNNFPAPTLIVSTPGIIIPPATLVYIGVPPPRQIRPFFSTLTRELLALKLKCVGGKLVLIKLFNECTTICTSLKDI